AEKSATRARSGRRGPASCLAPQPAPGARPTPAGASGTPNDGPYDLRPVAVARSVAAQYSVVVRVELDARQEPLGKLTAKIAESGGALQGVDLVPGAGGEGKRVREFTVDARDRRHWEQIMRAIGSTRGARVLSYIDRTLAMHQGGKIE